MDEIGNISPERSSAGKKPMTKEIWQARN